jgi:hypothetical protein
MKLRKIKFQIASVPVSQWRIAYQWTWSVRQRNNRCQRISNICFSKNTKPWKDSVSTTIMQNVFSNLFGDDEQWRQYTTRNFSSVACHPEVFDYYSQFCGVPILKDKYIGKLFNCYHLLDKSYSNYCTFYECTRQQASADFSLAIRQATVTCSRDSKLKWSI